MNIISELQKCWFFYLQTDSRVAALPKCQTFPLMQIMFSKLVTPRSFHTFLVLIIVAVMLNVYHFIPNYLSYSWLSILIKWSGTLCNLHSFPSSFFILGPMNHWEILSLKYFTIPYSSFCDAFLFRCALKVGINILIFANNKLLSVSTLYTLLLWAGSEICYGQRWLWLVCTCELNTETENRAQR